MIQDLHSHTYYSFCGADTPEQVVETAIAGDIIGIYDTGNYQIGDTLTTRKEELFFEPLPTFPPELFAMVSPLEPFNIACCSSVRNMYSLLFQLTASTLFSILPQKL